VSIVSVGVEWINDFHNDACSQNQLVYMNTHAEGFLNSMVSNGHTSLFDWGDDNAWETDFRNPSFGSGGDALNWSDNVNFCYFADHGGNWSNIMHIAFSKSHNQCLGSSDTWQLGVKNLKWLVLDVCDGTLDTTAAAVVDVWGGPMQGIHMIFSFVNLTSPWSSSEGSDFGSDAGSGQPLANAWLDRTYSSSIGNMPIAIAAGASQAEAINRRENETINWRDYAVTSTSWLAWKWRY
jgi:Family of unknown function (DUF6345)